MVDITLWFTLGTLGMLAGTAMLTYGLVLLPDHRRRLFSLIVAVPAIALVAYALMALGMGGLTTTRGTTVYVPRYVDWLLTTPIHVAVIALVVGADRRLVTRLVVLQALTIVFGFVGATLAPPANWLLYLLGAAAFAGVVYTFYVDLDALAADQSDGIAALFRKLRAFVVVLWLVYPVIWVLGGAGIGLMDNETATLVVAYIDVVSKVGFGLIAMNDYIKMSTIADAYDDSGPPGDDEDDAPAVPDTPAANGVEDAPAADDAPSADDTPAAD
jgi:sensory rhodopsin